MTRYGVRRTDPASGGSATVFTATMANWPRRSPGAVGLQSLRKIAERRQRSQHRAQHRHGIVPELASPTPRVHLAGGDLPGAADILQLSGAQGPGQRSDPAGCCFHNWSKLRRSILAEPISATSPSIVGTWCAAVRLVLEDLHPRRLAGSRNFHWLAAPRPESFWRGRRSWYPRRERRWRADCQHRFVGHEVGCSDQQFPAGAYMIGGTARAWPKSAP